jgi:flavin-dependent dehydrogenase
VFPAVVVGSRARSVGIAIAPFNRGESIPLRAAFAAWLDTIGLDPSAFEAKAYPSLRYEPQADCSRHRVLFVGDAAGVDPLFGEGITSGLALGTIAGQTAFDALRDHDFSFSNYERRIRRGTIGSMMCRRYMVARRLYSYPKLAQFLLHRGALLRGIALLTDPKTRMKLRWEPLNS